MVDKETVLKVAQLSKLKLKSEEVEIFSKQFNGILSLVEALKEVNTEGILPFYEIDLQESSYREDIVFSSISNQEALLNAPFKEGRFFVVPRVVG